MSSQREATIFEALGKQAILLVGDPRSLRTELLLTNPRAERLTIREAVLHLQSQESSKRVPVAVATLAATLLPGQTVRTRLTIEIDPHTSPGTYIGTLQVLGQTHPIEIHITEVVQLDLSPTVIVIDAAAGTETTKRVMVKNEGNVPLTIGSIGEVFLGEEVLLRRTLHSTVAPVAEQQKQLARLFAEVVDGGPENMVRETGVLQLRNTHAPLVIQPGAVQPLDLTIQLPKALQANSRYLARLPLYTATLDIVIVPAKA